MWLWYQFCRDVCSAKLLQDKTPFGGPDHSVEIDESLFFNRKNNIGRMCRKTWVVGCYDTTTRKGFLQRVPDTSVETMENVIRQKRSSMNYCYD
uniref:ISXO2-like transposase domain-containing protein n=1 Tax=Octopus bimaculoides TaxID=37653 RepID=A0A0L8FRK8_OCTBM